MVCELTQDYLKEIFDYNQITGTFIRIKDRQKKFIGKEAGTVTRFGYRRIKVRSKGYHAHKLAWMYVYGGTYDEIGTLDHIDRNKLNNSINNLRKATRSENCSNIGKRITNTTGYVGIVYVPGENKPWKAQVRLNQKRFLVGYFHTAEEAARARDKKALELHGEFSYLNFPKEEYVSE